MMNYRIETKGAFPLICKKPRVLGREELSAETIAPFWQACMEDGTIEALCRYIPETNIFENSIVGASFGKNAADPEYPYAIGAHYNGLPITDDGLTVEEIPAHTYVVFPCVGTDFEAYPSADVTDPRYTCEIWIAVERI